MIRIREASISDAGTIVDNNLSLALESEGLKLDREIVRKGVDAVIADRIKGFYLIAEDDGEGIGQCLVTYEWSDWRNGNFWWVQSVYVQRGRRKKGIFSTIFIRIREMAIESGAVGIRLYVDRENDVAISAYQHMGIGVSRYLMMENEFVR